MTNFTLMPTYYQVTWNETTPTNYTSVNGTGTSQDGGLDSKKAFDYYRTITVTGTTAITSTPMSAGSTLIINGYTITFAAADTMNDIIRKINIWYRSTKVIADQRVQTTYVSLSNSPGNEGAPIALVEGNGALAILGFKPGVSANFPQMVGGAYTTTTPGSNVTINGFNVVFSSAQTLAQLVSNLNAQTNNTGVVAAAAATYLQLAPSTQGQPFILNNVNATIGWSSGLYCGNPTTIAQSTAKELANMRWEQVIQQMSFSTTPSYVDNLVVTGNYIGNAVPTTFSFTVGFNDPDQIITTSLPTEPDAAGTVFIGEYAVQRWVARALTNSYLSNREVWNPTLNQVNAFAVFNNTPNIIPLTVAGIDITANIVTLAQNITVTPWPGL
jgi:hypothetical protein